MGIDDGLLCVLPCFHHVVPHRQCITIAYATSATFACFAHCCAVNIWHDVLQEGAEVDAKTTTGVTALWLAAGEGRKAVAADLIAKGSDVNNRRTDGITAVMAAAVGGHKV